KPTRNDSSGLHQRTDFAHRLRSVSTKLLVVVVFVCINMIAAWAQTTSPVHRAKTSVSVNCGGPVYDLGLVSVRTTLNGSNKATALGVVLSPKDAQENKVFCIYWVGDQTQPPTHRDDTKGTPDARPYGDGKINGGKDIFEDFFSQMKCPSDDPKIKAIL